MMENRNTGERGQRSRVEAASFSPLELNSLHEGLQWLLAFSQPPKIEILLCIRFLDALVAQGGHAWQAFGWEIAGYLARRLPSVSLWGLSPAEFGRIEAILLHAMKCGSIPGQNVRSTEAHLRSALDAVQDHMTRLDRLLRAAPGSDPADDRRDPPGEASILVPVIEKLNAAGHAPEFFSDIRKGSVIRMHVVVSDRSGSKERRQPSAGHPPDGTGEGEGPRLFGHIPGRTAGVLRDASQQLDSLGNWAAPTGRPRLDECVVSIRLSPEEARLDGDSAGLAFVLAAAVARASLAPGRRRACLAGGLAATGVLEATSVAPVEPRTLDAKVEAAFFSEVRLLLVPASQESEARACLERLLRAYPQRNLSLRGLSDAGEIPAPRVGVRRRPGPPRTLGLGDTLVAESRSAAETATSWMRWIGRSRWRTAAVLTVALAASTLAGWEIYRHWPVPAEVRWIDERSIELSNRSGVVFRQLQLSYRPASALPNPRYGSWFGVVDLEGGGPAKAVVIHGTRSTDHDLLSVIDWRGRTVWRVDIRSTLREWGQVLGDFQWHPFLQLPGERGQRLLLPSRSRQGPWSMLYIAERDAGGRYGLRGGLANTGHLERFPILDVTGDGVGEVLALGTVHDPLPDATPGSESQGRGIAAVLSPVAMSSRALPPDFDGLPRISTREALSAGVLAVWTFPMDRFSNQERAHVSSAEKLGEGRMRFSVTTGRIGETVPGNIFYYLSGEDLLNHDAVEVVFADAYRASIRCQSNEIDADAAIREESERLRFEVMALTSDGWRPVEQKRK